MRPMHFVAVVAALAAACAKVPFAQTPEALRPAGGETPLMAVAATGVQIYECRARKDSAGFEWVFVAPDAELRDSHGRRVGRHGAGPFWQFTDGSRVTGSVKARADAPAPDAVPWLLLAAKSDAPRPAPSARSPAFSASIPPAA